MGLAQGLYDLHSNGILHRDIKPENIVHRTTDMNSDVVLVDFGLGVFAKPINNLGDKSNLFYHRTDVTRELVGTPGYIAPESYAKSVYMDKSDVYSLGVILYIVLVGFPPVNGTDKNIEYRTTHGKLWPTSSSGWSHISAEAKKCVNKMMAVDPAQRYSAKEVTQDPWVLAHILQKNQSKIIDIPKLESVATASSFGDEYIVHLKSLRAKGRLRKVIHGVIGTVRMRKMCIMRALSKVKDDEDANANSNDNEKKNEDKKNSTLERGLTEILNVTIEQLSNLHLGVMNKHATMSMDGYTDETVFGGICRVNSLSTMSTGSNMGGGTIDSAGSGSGATGSGGGGLDSTIPLRRQGSVLGLGMSERAWVQAEEADVIEKKDSGTNSSKSLPLSLTLKRPLVDVDNNDGKDMNINKSTKSPRSQSPRNLGAAEKVKVNINLEIDFDEFCDAVKSVGLGILANRVIFDIFDENNNHRISPIEFIGALSQFSNHVNEEERTRLFFTLFDLDGNGFISKSELHNVVGMLVNEKFKNSESADSYSGSGSGKEKGNDDSSPHTPKDYSHEPQEHKPEVPIYVDPDDLFEQIDINHNGEISYPDFKEWFNKPETSHLFVHLKHDIDHLETEIKHVYQDKEKL